MLSRNSALKLSTKLGLCLVKVLHAREKERERERKRKGRGEPTRAERTEETEKDVPCAASDLPSSNEVLTAQSTEEEKRNPGRPQERKGGRRKRREERNGSGNSGPRIPKKPAAFSPQKQSTKASKQKGAAPESTPIPHHVSATSECHAISNAYVKIS